jgi:peptide/nickel transport system substrate-binding protein
MGDDVSRSTDDRERYLISRRDLLRRVAFLMGGATVAGPVLEACAPAQPAAPASTAAPAATSTPGAAPATAPTAARAAGQPRAGGTYTHGSQQEPDRLWGPVTGLTVSNEIEQLVNGALVRIDDRLQYVPYLATEVPTLENGGISKDGLTYTFKLHNNVKWHDGQPFTSKDVKFTYEVVMMQGVDVRGRTGWDQIDRVDTPDDYTVVYHFRTIDAPFLDRVVIASILPQHILGGLSADAINKHQWFRAPIGVGPYKFKEWVPGSYISLVKNPDYFKKGEPYFDTVVYKIVPDANSLLNQLQTGEIDSRVRLPNDQVDTVKGMKNVHVVSVPSVTPWLLWMNNTRPPFNDKSVRQALAYGFDKVGIAKNLLKGLVEPAWQLVSPLSWAYNPNVVKHQYDPDKAKQILDAAGWKVGSDGIREKDGNKLSFEILNIAGEQERVQILSFIQQQWKAIGVDAKIKAVDVGTMWGNALPKRDYQMAYSYTGREADPDISGWYLSPDKKPAYNFAGYSNPQVDDLLTQALQTVDRNKRKELYFKVQEIVADDVVYLFLFWLTNHTALNNRVQGYKPGPGWVEFWNADEWWLSQ